MAGLEGVWHNELPPLRPVDQWENPALLDGAWHNGDEYARQVLPKPEVDPNGRVFFVDSVDVIEGDLEDVWEPKIKSLKDREGEVAYVWGNQATVTASTLGTGTSVPMSYTYDERGQLIGTTSIRVVLCKAKKHYVSEGVEFCEKCCWTCQAADGSPFCTSCRKTMRAEEKEGESVRSFTSEHFPSLVPFLD
jgi:YD repeat-containing protein